MMQIIKTHLWTYIISDFNEQLRITPTATKIHSLCPNYYEIII